MKPQNFSHHIRHPPFLTVLGPFALALLVSAYFVVRTISGFSWDNLALTILALLVAFAIPYSRRHALPVQDRLIRLEERLRLKELLPDVPASRIDAIPTDQLIALRFASDGEVGELVQRVLSGELVSQRQIKRAVREWRPDHERV